MVDQFTFYVGGDPPPAAPTQTTVQNTNLPDYAQPYVESMLGAAQQQVYTYNPNGTVSGFKGYTPYSTNMNNYVAGFSPMQQQAFQGAANLQTPGQFGQGSQMTGMAGMGALQTAGQAGQMGQAGNNYFGMATNPGATQAFMNPYLQSALDPALAETRRQYGITGTQEQSAATQQGAFGGSREALMAAENNRNMNTAMNQMIGSGYQNAYDAAQKNMQYGAGLGLQGQQAAANAALQGYNQLGQAGAQLGQLGQQQLSAQEGILGLQNQYGGQQQAAEQSKINQAIQNYATAQQYPMMQLGNISNLLHGLPMQSTSTQTYQAPPTTLNTLAGIGTGIAGLSKLAAKGGLPKHFKTEKFVGGGIASLANRERIAENYSPQTLQKEVQNGVLPQASSMALSQDYNNYQKAAQAAQAAAQPQAPGIASAQTNLPTQTMAGGGIISFAQGNLVNTPKFGLDPSQLEQIDTTGYQDILNQYLNKDTNKPYTEEEIAKERRDKESKLGIKDFYADRMADIDKQKADIADQRNTAQGLALLAASSGILKNANKPGLMGVGEGLSEGVASYAPALKDIRANEAGIRKEQLAAQDAHTAMLQAQMAGDDKAFTDAQNQFAQHKTNIINAQNQNIQARNAIRTEGAKEEYGYTKEINKQLLDNFGKTEAAKITSGNADIGHINQAVANAQTELTAARAQHAAEYKAEDLRNAQSLVDTVTQTIANKGTPSADQIANKERAEKFIAKAQASENNIKNLEAKYKPYIAYIAQKANLPDSVVQSLAGQAVAPGSSNQPSNTQPMKTSSGTTYQIIN